MSIIIHQKLKELERRIATLEGLYLQQQEDKARTEAWLAQEKADEAREIAGREQLERESVFRRPRGRPPGSRNK